MREISKNVPEEESMLAHTFWSTTAVCDRSLLLAVAPVSKVMDDFPRTTPSRCAPAAALTVPATTQTMLLVRAPPARVTLAPAAMDSPPETWKIHAEKIGQARQLCG
jgi:hypothetical protein